MQKNPQIQCRKICRYNAEKSTDTAHTKTDVAEPGDCCARKKETSFVGIKSDLLHKNRPSYLAVSISQMHVHMHARTHVHTHTHTSIHTNSFPQTHTGMDTNTHIQTHTHTQMYTDKYMNKHLLSFCLFSPWYNHNGWLGIKHQVTYLLSAFSEFIQKSWIPMEHN